MLPDFGNISKYFLQTIAHPFHSRDELLLSQRQDGDGSWVQSEPGQVSWQLDTQLRALLLVLIAFPAYAGFTGWILGRGTNPATQETLHTLTTYGMNALPRSANIVWFVV